MKKRQWRGKKHAKEVWWLKWARSRAKRIEREKGSLFTKTSPFFARDNHPNPLVVDPSVVHVVETSSTLHFDEDRTPQ